MSATSPSTRSPRYSPPPSHSKTDADYTDLTTHPDPSSNTNQTIFQHFSFPVSYTVTGLLRRLSADQAPTALARALSANYNGSMTDPSTGVYHPPPPPTRRLSPFQPPPLTPLTLEPPTTTSSLLTRALAEEIRLLIPARLQLVSTWTPTYSLERDGSSLRRLFNLSDQHRGKRGGFVLVLKDSTNSLFGAYLTDAPHPSAHYYGTSECFLWRASRLPALPDLLDLPPPPSADTTHATRMTTIGAAKSLRPRGSHASSLRSGTSTPERIRFQAFPYTGENDFLILCQSGFLSVGGGDGKYGLWVDDSLAKGISAPCPTFGNEGLSEEGEKFGVLGVELWYIGS